MKHGVVCLVLLASCDVAIVERDQAIVGGTVDTADEAVVAIVSRRTRCEDTMPAVSCTGTLIAPQVVLTAAHCLLPGAGEGSLEVYVGAKVGDAACRFYLVDDAVRHPSFDDATHAFDLGLVHLAQPAAVTPVALPTATIDASFVGAAARVVGYGVTTAGTIADGQRRTGMMQVSAIAAATFDAMPAPSNTCGGDSGGPVFVTVGAGEQLLGVTVSGDAACTVNAVDARIDVALADFIQPYVAAPPPSPAGTIDADGICATECQTADDCPFAMACRLGRCQIAAAMPGDYTTACSHDSDCASQQCARVGPDDCRCHAACGTTSPDGCCDGGGGTSAWLAFVVIGCRRRRSAHRTRV